MDTRHLLIDRRFRRGTLGRDRLELCLRTARADAWTGDELGGTYPLWIRAQQTVLPTRGTITIWAPR
jgi:hypothetical protein